MNQDQYDRLLRGVAEWNEWREAHCGEVIDLREAGLRGADLIGAYLRYANLSEANLRGAGLRGAYLRYANLSEADLRGADLSGTELRYANLPEANLRGADLSGADLRYANFRKADLIDADFYGANLSGADLCAADLTDARNILSIGPGGSRGDILHAVRGGEGVMIYCGCFKGTIESFFDRVDHTHGDNEYGRYYRAVVEMVKVWWAIS